MKKPNQKTTLWAAALVAAVIVVMAVLVAVTPTQSSPQSSGGGQATSETKPSTPSGCNVRTGDTSNKPSLPADLRWQAAEGLTWPVSDTYGPTQSRGGFPVCFARSPLGAALAAVTIMYSQYSGHTAMEALKFYAVDSVGKTAALAKGNSGTTAGDLVSKGINVSGFITDEFAHDRAAVTLVFTAPQSSTGYMGIPMTLLWVHGDWRLKPQDDGNQGTVSQPFKGQFVSWQGSNG